MCSKERLLLFVLVPGWLALDRRFPICPPWILLHFKCESALSSISGIAEPPSAMGMMCQLMDPLDLDRGSVMSIG